MFVQCFWAGVKELCNHNYSACFFGVLQLSFKQFSSTASPTPILSLLSALFLPPEIKAMFLWFAVPSTFPLPPLFLPSSLLSAAQQPQALITHTSHLHMNSWSQYPALDIALAFSSPLALTCNALNSLLASQFLSGCLTNFKVWFWFWVKSSTFECLIETMSLVGKW